MQTSQRDEPLIFLCALYVINLFYFLANIVSMTKTDFISMNLSKSSFLQQKRINNKCNACVKFLEPYRVYKTLFRSRPSILHK